MRDLPPVYRDSALVRLRRPTPLPAAAQDFVEGVRERAEHMGLLAAL
jgi:hypothetical protein